MTVELDSTSKGNTHERKEVTKENIINQNSSIIDSLIQSKEDFIKKKFKMDIEELEVKGAKGLNIVVYEDKKTQGYQTSEDGGTSDSIAEEEMDKLSTIMQVSDVEGLQKTNDEDDNTKRIREWVRYEGAEECSEKEKQFYRETNINGDGNCLFESLILLINSNMSVKELKNKLLNSTAVERCVEVEKTKHILKTDNEYGETDCIFVFTQTYKINVCVHVYSNEEDAQSIDRVTYVHFVTDEVTEFIHLQLKNTHYTSLIPVKQKFQLPQKIKCSAEKKVPKINKELQKQIDDKTEHKEKEVTEVNKDIGPVRTKKRQDRAPPWEKDNLEEKQLQEDVPKLARVRVVREHPYFGNRSIVYMVTADCYPDTEVLETLTERRMLNLHEIESQDLKVGEVVVTDHKKAKLFGLIVKTHFDLKIMKIEILKCLQILKNLLEKFEIKEIAFIRDTDMMNETQTNNYIEYLNERLIGMKIAATFYKNNLTVSKAERRLELIKESHENAGSGHYGVCKSFEKLAERYFWRHMRQEVQHVIRNCEM